METISRQSSPSVSRFPQPENIEVGIIEIFPLKTTDFKFVHPLNLSAFEGPSCVMESVDGSVTWVIVVFSRKASMLMYFTV